MPTPPMERTTIRIFISYSHKDEEHCLELKKHLKPLQRTGIISVWYDREIKPGSIWDERIRTSLLASDIILFLISPDFIASDYIHDTEIRLAFDLHAQGRSNLIPIIVRQCNLEYTPFRDIQCIPKDCRAILSSSWFNKDDAYSAVAASLIDIIKNEFARKEMFDTEAAEWRRALQTDTNEGYMEYLQNSRLKTHIREVIGRLGEINLAEYLRKVNLDPLEHQVLRQNFTHVAQEVHDNLGQLLSVVKLQLGMLIMDMQDQGHDQHLQEVINSTQTLNKALLELRNISHYCRAQVFETNFSLEPAIVELISTYSKYNVFAINTDLKGISTIGNPELEINVFRIIQELFTNAMKHSSANSVTIKVHHTEEHIRFSFSDDGRGFDVAERTDGIGLKNIRSRVRHFNGSLTLENAPGKGVQIDISLPALPAGLLTEANSAV